MKKNNEKNKNRANETGEALDEKLDKVDCQLINLLQKDARQSSEALAKQYRHGKRSSN